MPFCTECGQPFRGTGSYCSEHEPVEWSSSSSSALTTMNGSGGLSLMGNGQPGTLGILAYSKLNDMLEEHRLRAGTITKLPGNKTEYRIEINADRRQCPWCKVWFPDEDSRRDHDIRADSGCAEHGVCFGSIENVVHAKHNTHDRCFVKDCESLYRVEDGWTNETILRHVREEHAGN